MGVIKTPGYVGADGKYIPPSIGGNGSGFLGKMDNAINVAGQAAFSAANPYWVNPNNAYDGNGAAAATMGDVTKAQWGDYQTRFQPIENQLMQQTTYMNPNLAGQEIDKATSDTARTYDNIAGSQAVQLGRYGMNITADQQQSSDRINALGKSGAIVDAANNIRVKLVERNQNIASGTAQSLNASRT